MGPFDCYGSGGLAANQHFHRFIAGWTVSGAMESSVTLTSWAADNSPKAGQLPVVEYNKPALHRGIIDPPVCP